MVNPPPPIFRTPGYGEPLPQYSGPQVMVNPPPQYSGPQVMVNPPPPPPIFRTPGYGEPPPPNIQDPRLW